MTTPSDPDDQNFESMNVQLNDGLRSCRAVVSNYRALLAGDGHDLGGPAGFGETEESSADSTN